MNHEVILFTDIDILEKKTEVYLPYVMCWVYLW